MVRHHGTEDNTLGQTIVKPTALGPVANTDTKLLIYGLFQKGRVLAQDGEAEFCRVAESHPKVVAYTKNHNLGLEVPYRYGSEVRKYLPDFIVLVDDSHGPDDLLHLVVEIKGYRREDAKEKKSTMDTYWVPGVNNLKTYGRWAFAEFTEVYQIETDFAAKVGGEFDKMIATATARPVTEGS